MEMKKGQPNSLFILQQHSLERKWQGLLADLLYSDGYFFIFFLLSDFFQNQLFRKILSRI